MKMSLCVLAALCGLFLCALTAGQAAPSATETFAAYPAEGLFDVTNGTMETVTVDGATVYRWKLDTGKTSWLALKADHPLLARLRDFDLLDFDVRIASGEISEMGLSVLGCATGARRYKLHQWGVAVTTTPAKVWHARHFDLARPNWFPWDNPDGEGADNYFRFDTLALTPGTVVELRNLRLTRGLIVLKPDYELPITWPVKQANEDGSVTYTTKYLVMNTSGKPTQIHAAVQSAHQRFRVAIDPPSAEAKVGQQLTFTVTATISQADIDATEDLYAEPLRLAFTPASAPDAAIYWEGPLVRPLSEGMKRQVILSEESIAAVRPALQAGDAAMKRLTNIDRIQKIADDFCAKQLLHIPTGHGGVSNNYPGDWRPGAAMPEAVNAKTGEREFGTDLAGLVWKEYFNVAGGACENLAMAYLLTGDEKYAQKAVELFNLYARQYAELPWFSRFDPVWNGGPATLSSSRATSNATYGSNWYFKGHCLLLSAIAESPSWTEEQRAKVYNGFVLPYATEIMKFRGGISNMTDVTNRNLLLMGIVFDDAGLVRFATMSEPGLTARLRDISPDGFSSEGRPLNYHLAAMSEYLPSIIFLQRSGLKIDYPKDRLLAALRMPYARANLAGIVPNTGDNGTSQGVRLSPLADELMADFPEETWLTDIGQGSTLSAKLYLQQIGKKADVKGINKLLDPNPRLFADAGMAILRTGDTPETQIMATLDYGRNVMHASLDRNQMTLSAFGRMYSHGPGSLYNAGSTRTKGTDPRLDSFCTHSSLGQNVILVDTLDQVPAIGTLLAWSAKPDFQAAVSRVEGIRPGVTHTRALVLADGLVVILDRVESAESHTYDFVYHNLGTLALGDGMTAAAAGKLGAEANYENIIDPQRLTGAGPVRLSWDLSGQYSAQEKTAATKAKQTLPALGLNLWQLPVAGGQAYIGTVGMNNPNTRTNPDSAPSLFTRVTGKTAAFCTVLEPTNNAQSKVQSVAADGAGIAITLTSGKTLKLSIDTLVKQYPVKK